MWRRYVGFRSLDLCAHKRMNVTDKKQTNSKAAGTKKQRSSCSRSRCQDHTNSVNNQHLFAVHKPSHCSKLLASTWLRFLCFLLWTMKSLQETVQPLLEQTQESTSKTTEHRVEDCLDSEQQTIDDPIEADNETAQGEDQGGEVDQDTAYRRRSAHSPRERKGAKDLELPRPSLMMTNLRVQAISHTSSLILMPRQSAVQPALRCQTSRLERILVAEVKASVMPWNWGARVVAVAVWVRTSGLLGVAAVVLSVCLASVSILRMGTVCG